MKLSAKLVLPAFALAVPLFGQEPVSSHSATLIQESDAVATTANEVTEVPTINEAVAVAVAILLENQERYKSDPPVGRLDDDELEDWQEKERKRLVKLRKRSKKKKGGALEWPYEGVYRVRPDGRIPAGYRVGGTSIVCEALLRAPGYEESKERKEAVQRGVEFVLDMLENDGSLEALEENEYDVRGWAHAYGLNLLMEVSENNWVDKKTAKQCRDMIPDLIGRLETGIAQGGGWNYAGYRNGASPFMTGPTLLFLFRAKEYGYDVPEELITNALDALENCRVEETGSFHYSLPRKRSKPEKMAASSGRSAIAELALFQAGRSDAARLRMAVMGFFDNWEHLFDRKSQQGTHVGPYKIAPYYFFFAHTYAGLAIESLPEKERPQLRERLQKLLWDTRESHGGWNDRIFPRTESYSTAMSVLALLSPELPKPATWDGPIGSKNAPDADSDKKSSK